MSIADSCKFMVSPALTQDIVVNAIHRDLPLPNNMRMQEGEGGSAGRGDRNISA